MANWPEFVKHAFHAPHILDTEDNKQAIPAFAARFGGLDLRAFERTLREGSSTDQQIAASAIGSFPSRWARDLLLPLLRHEHPAVRWTVATELGRMREEQAFPVLLSIAQEFLPPHAVPVDYDWYDIHHLIVASQLGAFGKPEAIPVLRQTLVHLWHAEWHRSSNQDIQMWWHYQDVIVAALGQLGDWQALSDLSDLSTERQTLWAVMLVFGYLGYCASVSVVHYAIMDLLTSRHEENPSSRLVLVPDLLREHCGWTADQAADYSDAYQQTFLFRWEHDAPPESFATPR